MTRARRTPAVILLLALSLLLAQTAAQAHAYSHLQLGSPTSDFSGTAGQLCGECLASAALLGTAGAPNGPHLFFAAALATPVAVAAVTCAERPRYYAFRSRAPPASR